MPARVDFDAAGFPLFNRGIFPAKFFVDLFRWPAHQGCDGVDRIATGKHVLGAAPVLCSPAFVVHHTVSRALAGSNMRVKISMEVWRETTGLYLQFSKTGSVRTPCQITIGLTTRSRRRCFSP